LPYQIGVLPDLYHLHSLHLRLRGHQYLSIFDELELRRKEREYNETGKRCHVLRTKYPPDACKGRK
jgi:hypothetical protein